MRIIKVKKVMFAGLTVVLVLISGTFQSCSNEMDAAQCLDKSLQTTSKIEKAKSLNKDELISSREFEEWIEVNIELISTFRKLDSIPKNKNLRKDERTGIAKNGNIYYHVSSCEENRTVQKALLKSNELLDKFPNLTNLNYNDLKSLILEAVSKSHLIRKVLLDKGLISKKKQNVRQKTGVYEGNGVYVYDNLDEAYLNAMFYSMIYNNECSGYVLANGTAVLYINPNGQHGDGSYPGPIQYGCQNNVDVAIYNGQNILATYHTHFNGSNWSSTDNTSQYTYFPSSPMIILYGGSAYYYNYSNGYNNGTPSAVWSY